MIFPIINYSISPSGVIAEVRDSYRKHQIPMPQLLSDYAAVYLPHYLATTAINPWAQRETQERLPFERGVTIAETMMLTEAVKLKKCLPTDVVRALFYNKDNNDSAVECCVLRPVFRNYSRRGRQSAVINPSPGFLLEDFLANDNTIYIVPDQMIAKLYRVQFKTERIISFNEVVDLPQIDTYLIMQRQYPYLEKLFAPLSLHSEKTTVLALLPSTVIDKKDETFWKSLDDTNMYVRSAIRIDSKILSKPRKKTLLTIATVPQNEVTLWDSSYDRDSSQFSINGPVRTINYDRFRYGAASVIQMLNVKEEEERTEKKSRSPAKHFDFSDEIRLSYTIKTDNSGSPKITASYHAILQPGETRNEGKRLSENYIRRIGSSTPENILSDIVLGDTLRPLIAADVRGAFGEAPLTLKTCWYLCIDRLETDREYNKSLAREWFASNNALSKIRLAEATEDDMLRAAEEALGLDRDSIDYTYWRQLDLLIRKARQAGLACSNPIEAYVQSRSSAYTKRQAEVREALTKKTLEPLEMLRVMEWICEDTSQGKKYRTSVEAAAAVLKILGLSNAEICALTWGDYREIPYIGRQLKITKFLGTDGKICSYDTSLLRKIRFVPLPIEEEFMLDAYYDFIKNTYDLDDNKMMNRPILSEDDRQESNLSLRRMRTITKHMLAAVQIDPLMIVLHDGAQTTPTDLHAYRGDFFHANADFYFGHLCGMKEGEICYLLGDSAPTTLDRHYLDYTYDLMQYRMMTEMRRWLCRFDDIIGVPSAVRSEFGIRPLKSDEHVVSDGQKASAAQILFPEGCPENGRLFIRAENGIKWDCIIVRENRIDN